MKESDDEDGLRYREVADAMDRVTESLSSYKARTQRIEEERSALRRELFAIKKKNQDLTASNAKLKGRLKQCDLEARAHAEKQADENARLTFECEIATARLDQLKERNRELQKSLSDSAGLRSEIVKLQSENSQLWRVTDLAASKKGNTWRRSSRAVSVALSETLNSGEDDMGDRAKLQALREMKISKELSEAIFGPLKSEFVIGIVLQQSPPQLKINVTKNGVPSVRVVDIEPHSDDWRATRHWATLKEVKVESDKPTPSRRRLSERRKSMKS